MTMVAWTPRPPSRVQSKFAAGPAPNPKLLGESLLFQQILLEMAGYSSNAKMKPALRVTTPPISNIESIS